MTRNTITPFLLIKQGPPVTRRSQEVKKSRSQEVKKPAARSSSVGDRDGFARMEEG
jgi:hypothetical protein